jgi:hypothetical protein
MKNLATLIAIAGTLSLVSCGPSAEDKAAAQKRADSTRNDSMMKAQAASMKMKQDSMAKAAMAKDTTKKDSAAH